MKVLHVIPSIASIRGGPSQAIIEMVAALRNNHVDVEIATTNDNGLKLLDVPLGKRIEYKKVPVWFFPRFSPTINALAEFAFSAGLTSWLWHNIDRYDLVHVHGIFSYPSTAAMKIARLKNIPYIVRPLGQLCHWSLQQAKLKKQIYLKIIEKANLDRSSSLHLTSKQEQQELRHLNLENSFILPHGLSIPDRITEANSKLRAKFQLPQDPVILFLSRIHPKKGLDLLIPALGKVQRQFTFILAGEGDRAYEREIDDLLHKHDLNSRTIKTGFVSGEAKNILLQGADLFVLTSYSENFGVAVLEALAAGTPTLTTPGVALSEILEKESLGYVTELDIDAIASNLEYILSHPKEVSDRHRQFVRENYSWDTIALKMIDIYKSVVNERSRLSIT